MGGIVIPKAAELARERVAHLVFLAAVVLPSGGSLERVHLSPASRALMRGLAAGRGDGTFLYSAETAWARWMGDLPRHHPAVSRALALLTPQPLRPFVEPVDLSRFYTLSVPRTYVRCLGDLAVPPARAAGYAARLGVQPVDMKTAHNPMLSAPRGAGAAAREDPGLTGGAGDRLSGGASAMRRWRSWRRRSAWVGRHAHEAHAERRA